MAEASDAFELDSRAPCDELPPTKGLKLYSQTRVHTSSEDSSCC